MRSRTRVAGEKSKSIDGTMIPPTLIIRSLMPDLIRKPRLCVTFAGRNAPCLSRRSAPPRAEACSSLPACRAVVALRTRYTQTTTNLRRRRSASEPQAVLDLVSAPRINTSPTFPLRARRPRHLRLPDTWRLSHPANTPPPYPLEHAASITSLPYRQHGHRQHT